ncbi:MAG: DUF2911 domain-containing protein [Gemmatimonadetes bacterium]|nr:DUF2911 domain-containing protein [Gemmatimonadota bacterium]
MLLPALLATLTLPLAGPAPAPAACIVMNAERMPLARRGSPLDSLTFKVGSAEVKLCYSRPAAKGRTMIGGSFVPFGTLWRTGANEPTMLHTTGPNVVAGVALAAGSYSLYTVPGATEWQVIPNRSITQWGHESAYTDAVKAQEVGHGTARSSALATAVESLTFRAEPGAAGAVNLLLEWEKTRVTIPVTPGR